MKIYVYFVTFLCMATYTSCRYNRLMNISDVTSRQTEKPLLIPFIILVTTGYHPSTQTEKPPNPFKPFPIPFTTGLPDDGSAISNGINCYLSYAVIAIALLVHFIGAVEYQ